MIRPIEFEIEGETVQVIGQNLNGKIWLHYAGQNILIENELLKSSKRKSLSVNSSGDLLAPMPGKITKIFKSTQMKVTKGEAVLVMEAMKMEYTIKAEVDGVIEQINCQLSDQVALGKLLVRIQKSQKEIS